MTGIGSKPSSIRRVVPTSHSGEFKPIAPTRQISPSDTYEELEQYAKFVQHLSAHNKEPGNQDVTQTRRVSVSGRCSPSEKSDGARESGCGSNRESDALESKSPQNPTDEHSEPEELELKREFTGDKKNSVITLLGTSQNTTLKKAASLPPLALANQVPEDGKAGFRRRCKAGSMRSSGEIFCSALAVGFDMRANINMEDHHHVLNEMRFALTGIDAEAGSLPLLHRIRCCGARCLQFWTAASNMLNSPALRFILEVLAMLSAIMIPLFIAMKPSCHWQRERHALAAAEQTHAASTLAYLLLSAGEVSAVPDGSILQRIRRLLRRCMSRLSAKVRQQEANDFINRAKRYNLNSWGYQPPLWTVLDGAVGLGLIAEVINVFQEPGDTPSLLQWLLLLSSLKMWRCFAPHEVGVGLRSSFWVLVLELFLSLFLFTHLCACLFVLVATYELAEGNTTWADELLHASTTRSCTDLYVHSLYFSAYTVTSIGYGDVTPSNTFEKGVTAVVMIISQMYVAKVFADLNFFTSVHNHWWAKRFQSMSQTSSALRSMQVPQMLEHRVLAFLQCSWCVNKQGAIQECLRDLPEILRTELQIVLYHQLVIQAPFLSKLSVSALRHIISELTDAIYLPADFIIRRGETGSELFFLRNGCAAVYVTQAAPSWEEKQVLILRRGDYFGEVALLTGQPRASWVMAWTYCVCSVLHKKAIDEVMSADPSCISMLVNSMKTALNLRPGITWSEVAKRLEIEFDGNNEMYEFIAGRDKEEQEGLITWEGYRSLMRRIKVKDVDQKLLWVELDPDEGGKVHFREFLAVAYRDFDANSAGSSCSYHRQPSKNRTLTALANLSSADPTWCDALTRQVVNLGARMDDRLDTMETQIAGLRTELCSMRQHLCLPGSLAGAAPSSSHSYSK